MFFLSLIIPVYNEAQGLDALIARLLPVAQGVTEHFELVFVDDGSRDDTYARLKAWRDRDARIKIVKFSRNFGKEAALTAGIDAARGDAIIPLDADLQDPPEIIPQMVEEWRKGFKVVLATRRSRPGDTWVKRMSAGGFYRIFSRMSSIRIPANTGDFRLMDRQAAEAVRALRERTRFMKGIFAWVGFPTAVVHFDREGRHAGTSSWNYWKLWKFAVDGILSFSTLPLRIWTYLGLLCSLTGFLYAGFLIARAMIVGVDVPGYTSLMVVVLILGGLQLTSLGIIGQYVGRIYRETKQRPLYVIEERLGFSDEQ